jgi:hypothetical protein
LYTSGCGTGLLQPEIVPASNSVIAALRFPRCRIFFSLRKV